MESIFTVIFNDKTIFSGGVDYKETKWLAIPNKKIKTIFYRLPTGAHLCLSEYDKFYHMIEATMDLNGQESGQTKIEYVHIMGKKGKQIVDYKIGVGIKQGILEMKQYNIKDDFIKKLNKQGWK